MASPLNAELRRDSIKSDPDLHAINFVLTFTLMYRPVYSFGVAPAILTLFLVKPLLGRAPQRADGFGASPFPKQPGIRNS